MNRKIELGFGDIKIEVTEGYLALKNVDEELLVRFDLNDDKKTCKATFTPAFEEAYEFKKVRPYELSITDNLGRRIYFNKKNVIERAEASDLPDFLKKYVRYLIRENFNEMEEGNYPTGFFLNELLGVDDD